MKDRSDPVFFICRITRLPVGTILVISFAKYISMRKMLRNPQQPVNTIKDPDEWKTGDEPMTGAQRSYLHTLASEAKEDVEDDLSKAEAAKKIDDLQHKTGRGVGQNQ